MSHATTKDGTTTLEGDDFSLKIDVNRIEYIKKPDADFYTATGTIIPKGHNARQKERYLSNLYLLIKEELNKKDE